MITEYIQKARRWGCRFLIGWFGPAVALCLVGVWIGPAAGYVLEGPHVLKLMADKLDDVKTLKVDQQVMVEDPAIAGEPVSLNETLRFMFPGNFRSDSVLQGGSRVHVDANGQTLTIVDNKIIGTTKVHYDQYKDLLLYKTDHMLQKTLYLHGVDVGITSLGRLHDQVVFVIGANFPNESVSQVWVDNEQFFPVRWLIVQPRSGHPQVADRWEFFYSQWQKVDGTYYPFKIETFHNGQRIRLIRVVKADSNAVIDGELFNIAHLRSVYQEQAPPVPEAEKTPSGMDEVQRTIEEFKKKFEP